MKAVKYSQESGHSAPTTVHCHVGYNVGLPFGRHHIEIHYDIYYNATVDNHPDTKADSATTFPEYIKSTILRSSGSY